MNYESGSTETRTNGKGETEDAHARATPATQGADGQSQRKKMAPRPIENLVGKTFGKMTVIGTETIKTGRGNRQAWRVKCECGTEKTILTGNLKRDVSCGCVRRIRLKSGNQNRTHGRTETTLYNIWMGIKARCNNPKSPAYPRYGGRGIKMTEEWKSFENFARDVGARPSRDHTLDRRDNNLGYCKENCRWATMEEQQNNRGNNRKITIAGETKNLEQWAKQVGLSSSAIAERIAKGWTEEKAIFHAKQDPKKNLTHRFPKRSEHGGINAYRPNPTRAEQDPCEP